LRKGRLQERGVVYLPTESSIIAHRANHVGLAWPVSAFSLIDMMRMMAKIMQITPTPKMQATLIFSARVMRRFQSKRIGRAITTVCGAR
jgi:hypothetical protein